MPRLGLSSSISSLNPFKKHQHSTDADGGNYLSKIDVDGINIGQNLSLWTNSISNSESFIPSDTYNSYPQIFAPELFYQPVQYVDSFGTGNVTIRSLVYSPINPVTYSLIQVWINVGTDSFFFTHEDAAADDDTWSIITPDGNTFTLASHSVCIFIYDLDVSRWRVFSLGGGSVSSSSSSRAFSFFN